MSVRETMADRLARFTFRGALEALEARVEVVAGTPARAGGPVQCRAVLVVPAIEDGAPFEVASVFDVRDGCDDEVLLTGVLRGLAGVLRHEVGEGVLLDGVAPLDPHRDPHGLAARWRSVA